MKGAQDANEPRAFTATIKAKVALGSNKGLKSVGDLSKQQVQSLRAAVEAVQQPGHITGLISKYPT